MVLPLARHPPHLIQKILLGALPRDENQARVRRLLPRPYEVPVRIMRVPLIVQPPRHGSCNDAACHGAYVAEGEVVGEGLLVVAVDEGDGDPLVWVALAQSEEVAGCGGGGVCWGWGTGVVSWR